MQQSQTEKGFTDERSKTERAREQARDEMSPDVYDELLKQALALIEAS